MSFTDVSRNLKALALRGGRFVWRRKGLWLRALLCLLIGMIFAIADSQHDYDMRLQLRGEQPADRQIVLILITPEDWAHWLGEPSPPPFLSKEFSAITDSYFWHAQGWEKILSLVLRQDPLVVGVLPYFGANIPNPPTDVKQSSVFSDSRIVWSAQLDDEGRILPSRFAKTYSRNSGLNEHLTDRDGLVRRFGFTAEQIPHFATQVARHIPTMQNYDWTRVTGENHVINYRGKAGTFSTLHLRDLVERQFPDGFIKDKIILFGVAGSEESALRTPLGPIPRAEVVANLIDNMKNDRWIERPDWLGMAAVLLACVILVAFATSNYPQFLALFIVVFGNILLCNVGLWIFDSFYFWIPLFAIAFTSFVTYITFLSFQLTLTEYTNAQLENERRFLIEVEQLKHNFLSLISHDLKTPIAKIQAICDRLLTQSQRPELSQDLNLLREVASELHRYIQTILQITRVESRDFRIHRDAADINEIIEAVVAQLEPLAKAKRISLSAALEPIFLIEVDQVLIHEVILNLVDNAIKYTPESGTVKISSQEVDDRVIIMVEDTGPGIPSEEQARIFEKFYRGELGKSQPKGSGLGLYLVKYFVELHEGRVFLDSSPKGTRISISLPIGEGEGDTVNEGDATTDSLENRGETGMTSALPERKYASDN